MADELLQSILDNWRQNGHEIAMTWLYSLYADAVCLEQQQRLGLLAPDSRPALLAGPEEVCKAEGMLVRGLQRPFSALDGYLYYETFWTLDSSITNSIWTNLVCALVIEPSNDSEKGLCVFCKMGRV